MELEVKTIEITDIHEAEYNPRTISNKELTKLKNNIKEYGIVDPIIVNLKNNNIVGGHQRYKALQSMGIKKLQMIIMGNMGWVFTTDKLDIKDEDEEKILNLSLNNISGEWDNSLLNIVLQDLKSKNKNYKLTGFDDLDLERIKIDTDVLFEENVIGKSWDKFKKAQGEDDWKNKYENQEEENQEEYTEKYSDEEYDDDNLNPNDEEYYYDEEEEDLENLKEGIIREEDKILIEDEISCPDCGRTITIDMFETNYYDKVDE